MTREHRVGIDIEYVRLDVEYGGIAARHFSPRELKTFRSLPLIARREAFFTRWVRKEAYIKARGEGLSLPLDRFDVSLAPGSPPRYLRIEEIRANGTVGL